MGISTFTNSIPYSSLFENDKLEIKILAVLIPIFLIINLIVIITRKILNKENEISERILTIFIYSFSIIILMYPITDEIHFLIASLISIINVIYIIGLSGKKIYNKINYNQKYKTYQITSLMFWMIFFTTILIVSVNNLYEYIKLEKNQEIQHYKNIYIPEYLESRINQINEYIENEEKKGNKVYILDAEAAIYMIPINKYNKNYDMFLKGNLGKDGEEKIIEQIRNKKENEIILILNRNIPYNWQTPTNIINIIREELEQIEGVSIYEAYK